MKPADKLLTTAEVAKREKVSVQRITALARNKRFSGCTKHGPNYLFAPDYKLLPAPVRPGRAAAKMAKKKGPKT